jgi:molybdopterin molybdotransferase
MQEYSERSGNSIRITRSVTSGENVQEKGEDFKKGDLLFAAGHRLRAQDVAALAMFGITKTNVFRKPILKIISTGNELIPFSSKTIQSGQIRETNSLAITAAARKFGFHASPAGIVPDELEAQRHAVANAMHEADVILVSGGSSVGERDFTMDVVHSFANSHVHFHGLAIRPGHPTIFASVGNHWIFGLPGHPVSSLIVFYVIVLPFLFHLSGEKIEYFQFLKSKFRTGTARLMDAIQPLKAKTDYVRLRLTQSGNDWSAAPLPGKSASLSTLSSADAFTIVPPGEPIIPSGQDVEFFFLP